MHPLHLSLDPIPHITHSRIDTQLVSRSQPLLQFLQCNLPNVHPEVASHRHRASVNGEAELLSYLTNVRVLITVEHSTTLECLLAHLRLVHRQKATHQLLEPLFIVRCVLHQLEVIGGSEQTLAVVIPGQGVFVEPSARLSTQGLDGFQRRAVGEEVLVNRGATLAACTLAGSNFLLDTLVFLTCFPHTDIEGAQHGGGRDAGDGVNANFGSSH